MTDEIAPALTPEEWRIYDRAVESAREKGDALIYSVRPWIVNAGSTRESLPRAMTIANAALPDDSPYKITRSDLDKLDCAASALRHEYGSDDEDAADLDALAAKLAALLPPEGQ